MIKYMIGMLLILTTQAGNGKEILSRWETAQETCQLKLQYRWVLIGDTLNTREMRTIFYIKACPENIISNFLDPDKLKQWAACTRVCRIYSITSREWIIYTQMDIPKIFPQQDVVVKYSLVQNGNNTHILMEPVPEFLPQRDGIKRLQHYDGHWVMSPQEEGFTKVEFYSTSFSGPVLPRFIQDPILQGIFIRSFESLTQLSETNNGTNK